MRYALVTVYNTRQLSSMWHQACSVSKTWSLTVWKSTYKRTVS